MEQIAINNPKKPTKIKVKLSLVSFKEGDQFIVYCPSLDLSGYGDTEKEAFKSFDTTLSLTIAYCIEHGTLKKMLESFGWIKSISSTYKTGSISSRININDYLQNIINQSGEVKIKNNYEAQLA